MNPAWAAFAGALVLAGRPLTRRHRGLVRLGRAADVLNNLPAVLVLLPLAAPSGPGAVLAVLLGVNIGPNLTYTGSLATLLWRRVLRERRAGPSLREFTMLGCSPCPLGWSSPCSRCGRH